jgi:hypothetical protein
MTTVDAKMQITCSYSPERKELLHLGCRIRVTIKIELSLNNSGFGVPMALHTDILRHLVRCN